MKQSTYSLRALAVGLVAVVGSLSFAMPAGAATTVYTNDFSSAVGAEWTGFTALGSTPNVGCTDCGSFMGPFPIGASTLTLTGLAAHDTVTLDVDLFILHSWDGDNAPGPDAFSIVADGSDVFNHTFTNVGGHTQNYPAPGSSAFAGAANANELGFNFYGNAVYKPTHTFAHSASTLTLTFYGLAAQGWTDEGWGIDDIAVGISTEGTPTCTTTLLADTFDGENGGANAGNYAGFANWTVSAGTVDLVGVTIWDFWPGNGMYVDLDGSSSDAGVLTSSAMSLPVGDVVVTFELAGNNRVSTQDVVTVTLGSLYTEDFTLSQTDPMTLVTRVVTVAAPTSASLAFSNAGGDNYGAFVDDVTVCTAADAVVDDAVVCPAGHGFWKNNLTAWPEGVEGLWLGGEWYTNETLVTILKTPVGTGKKADASLILAYQLIATNLSVLSGADGSVVQSEVDNATALLEPLGRIPTVTAPSTATGTAMVQNASKLDAFVNGLLTEGCHTDVELVKTGPATAADATSVTFTLNVTNLAWVTAKGVVVTDTLPAGWTYVSNDAGCAAAGQVVTCNLGDMPAQASVEFHIVATASGCATHTNTATVTSTSEPAGHSDNNTDTADVTVTDCAA